jgi:hypothetical protein
MLQLHIRQVPFLWDEATLHRVKTTLMMVLNSAFDISPFTGLVDTLYAMHALQTIHGLMFNRALVNKVPIMNYGSSLGYRPTQTGADVLRLMKDVRIFSFLMNLFTEQPLLPKSPLLLQQVLDGLLRMLHHLPDHVCHCVSGCAYLPTALCSTLQIQADHSSHGPTHQCGRWCNEVIKSVRALRPTQFVP